MFLSLYTCLDRHAERDMEMWLLLLKSEYAMPSINSCRVSRGMQYITPSHCPTRSLRIFENTALCTTLLLGLQIEIDGLPQDDPAWPTYQDLKGLLRCQPGQPISTRDMEADCFRLQSTGVHVCGVAFVCLQLLMSVPCLPGQPISTRDMEADCFRLQSTGAHSRGGCLSALRGVPLLGG